MEEPSNIETSTLEVDGKRSRGDAPATTLVADMAVVQTHAQWWTPELKPHFEAIQSSVVEGVDGAISARVADECNRVLGQELTPGEEETHASLAHEGKLRELAAWERFDVYSQREACNVQQNNLRRHGGF